MITRRMFVSGAAAMAGALSLDPKRANAAISYGPAVRFNWDALVAWSAELARFPHTPHLPSNRDLIYRIDYDAYHQIRYRPDAAIRPGGQSYPVELFHVGRYFMDPVRIFIVSEDQSREVLYNIDLFSYGRAEFARELSPDTGFAGFRVLNDVGQPDWISFLGASYFRSPGETRQYGLSARGLAINTGMPEPEEFPRFTNFWVESLSEPDGIMIYALLESPSATGAYRIRATRGQGVITAVDCIVHPRSEVHRVGFAPLTSMFWYGKNNRIQGKDWRPEIHDSDGLAMWTGSGERIWRPLNNPPVNKLSSFVDKAPKGFGLIQRERDFRAYEDDNVFYNRRPSVWIEPVGDWGEGAVQLLENTTDDETKDNIVAFWNPREAFTPGKPMALSYRIHWRNDMPFTDSNARVISTRTGWGGIPGGLERMSATKYVIDFEGGIIGQLGNDDGVKLRVSTTTGYIDAVASYRVVDSATWRAIFDFHPDGKQTADLRAYLDLNGKALSETWLYQHV